MPEQKYKRVLLKISGESLKEDDCSCGIDFKIMGRIAQEIKETSDHGIEVAVVIGGGNFWRGAAASQLGMERAAADYVGMIATVMNAVALQDALEKKGVITRVMSAITMQEIAEPFIRRRAEDILKKRGSLFLREGPVTLISVLIQQPHFELWKLMQKSFLKLQELMVCMIRIR